jgi:hypothetical protein
MEDTDRMTDPTTPETEVPLTTALAHASQRVPTARPSESAGDIRQRLIGGDRFDTPLTTLIFSENLQ